MRTGEGVVEVSETVSVLVIPADGPVRLERVEATYETWCRLVEDVGAEAVFLPDETGVAWVAANGKTSSPQLERNLRAGGFLDRLVPGFDRRDWVAGTAIVVGLDPATGDFAELSTGLLSAAADYGLLATDPK